MEPTDIVPAEPLIKKQLARMLACKRFVNALRQGQFLKLVVTRTLKGKDCSEKSLGPLMYRDFHGDVDPHIRIFAGKVRKSLVNYYQAEGRADLVVIDLPKPRSKGDPNSKAGEPYTPTFSYNPQHPVSREVQLAEFFLSRAHPNDETRAQIHLSNVINKMPRHLGALICYVELATLMASVTADEAERREYETGAAQFLNIIQELAPQWWKLYAVGGWLMIVSKHLDRAAQAFDKALALDPLNTKQYPGYHKFLGAIGKVDEGLELARQYLDSKPSIISAYRNFFEIAILAGRPELAIDHISTTLQIDKEDPISYGMLYYISRSAGEREAVCNVLCGLAMHLAMHRCDPYQISMLPEAAEFLYSPEQCGDEALKQLMVSIKARFGLPAP